MKPTMRAAHCGALSYTCLILFLVITKSCHGWTTQDAARLGRATSSHVSAPRPRRHLTSSRPRQISTTALSVVFTKLSQDCLQSLMIAQETAQNFQQSSVDNACLLYGITHYAATSSESLGDITDTLLQYNLSAEKIKQVLDDIQQDAAAFGSSSSKIPKLSDFNTQSQAGQQDLPYSAECQQTLFDAGTTSAAMGSPEIQPQHIFLALLQYKEDPVSGEATAATRSDLCDAMEILYNIDATLEGEDICMTLLQNMMKKAKEKKENKPAESKGSSSRTATRAAEKDSDTGAKSEKDRAARRSLIADLCTDLTEMARQDKLDKVHGRQQEIQACFQTLVRRRKNNVCLIGESGVGKTSIVEGIAQILIDEQACPIFLQNTRIISLQVSSLLAGTRYRGEFEERLKDIIEELSISTRYRTILFIDDIHQLVGAGATGDGSMDASNILKPYLTSSGTSGLQVIGATTIVEYSKYIARDAGLERRFQPILIREPSITDTVEILRAIIPFYQSHHKVEFSPAALEAAAQLTDRYIHDRFLPDKAIDVLDEAGALASLRRDPIADPSPPEVSEQDITDLISQWTNIPVGKLQDKDEMGRLQQLESKLQQRVKGQQRAVHTVAKAIRRARTGIRNPRRPIASFLFCGPTGTGKTELCKTLAETYFGSERDLIRIDMSEYMETSSVARLTGPPPGFVGYEEGGQLTEAIRRAPHSVVLLDELEKAHSDVLNILLQILEDGLLTDGKGRQVSFKNSVIIMTSNIGSKKILRLTKETESVSMSTGQSSTSKYNKLVATVNHELEKVMRPEFLNRIDDIVVFEPLTEDDMSEIASMMVEDISHRAAFERGMEINVGDSLLDKMVEEGSGFASNQFGARPMRRAVQRILEDAISDAVVQNFLEEGDKALFDLSDELTGSKELEDDSYYTVCVKRERDGEILLLRMENANRDVSVADSLDGEESSEEKDGAANGSTNDSAKQPAYLLASDESTR